MARHRFWASFLEIEETPLTGLVSLKTDSSAVNVHLRWCPSFLSFELFSGSSIYLFFRPSTLSPPHSLSSPSPLPLFITLALQVAIFSLQDRYKWHHSAEKKQERTAWWDSSPPFFFLFFFLALPAQWSDQKTSTVRAHIQVGAMHMTRKPSRNAKKTPSRSCCSLLLRPNCVD